MRRIINKHILTILTTIIAGIVITSCRDELLYDNSIIGEGEANLSATLSFTPMGVGLDTRSSGTAVKEFDDVCVVVYTADGKFFTKFMAKEQSDYHYEAAGNKDYPTDTPTAVPGGDKDSGYDKNSEKETPQATFKYKSLPYGRYRIYAVANLGMLSDEVTETEETLKSHRVEWNENVSKDNSMFGYFTLAKNPKSSGFSADIITVDKPNIELHCWLKRTVSKVTVAFDPSGLKEAVTVYIRSVTIHDIPKECTIGENNKPSSKEDLIADGETIIYENEETEGGESADGENDESFYSGWLKLQKGYNVKGSADHLEEDDALYFYENMQGDYEGQENYLKQQIKANTGTPINDPKYDDNGTIINDYKDCVPYGTYIEVEGYYVSQNKEKISKGPIKYRFMLGQNTTYNYNAERNCHYKLTLRFHGWANQADWHIVYDEVSPTIFIPDPYYISYLYNESMTLPIRITGYNQVQKYKLHAQIIENNWAPSTKSGALAPQSGGTYNEPNGFAWNKYAYDHTYKDENYVGFLSLRELAENEREIIGSEYNYGEAANEYLKRYYLGEEGQHIPVYYADYALNDIKIELPINGNKTYGTYDIEEGDNDNSVTLKIPMFTRQKELVPATDFSGNNAFFAFYRKATVRFSLRNKDALDPSEDKYSDTYDKPFKIKKEIRNPDGSIEYNPDGSIKYDEYEAKYVDIDILQVPRIVNPKAIWRSHNSQEEFHVELMELDGAGESSFNTFESDGPWRASILEDPKGLIKLYAGSQEVTEKGKYIEGSTGTVIDFWYKPNGVVGEYETRCGIILVEYHDYTCKHLIFVRQGYDCGVTLGGESWSCYNAYAAEGNRTDYQPDDRTNVQTETNVIVTNSPLSVGSLFKRSNYDYAILESNESVYGWLDTVAGDLNTVRLKGSTLEERSAKWGDIQGYGWTNYGGDQDRSDKSWATNWNAVNKNNKKLTVPTYDQYLNLRDSCKFGYGVVYADGAQSVAKNAEDAYGYTNYSNASGENAKSSKGMRACIAYNKDTGDNIIFPVGATGQARRSWSNFKPTYNSTYNSLNLDVLPNPGPGAISYGGVSGLLYASAPKDGRSNNDRPLTFNLYRESGGIYWFRKPNKNTVYPKKGNGKVASWDINYYTLLFNAYDSGSLNSGSMNASTSSDALPIKFIYK